MTSTLDIAWLAGYLEGEGSFYTSKGGSAQISVSSTDIDPVLEFRRITNNKHLAISLNKGRWANHKSTYRLVVTGSSAIQWMMIIYRFMSDRRKERIREVLAYWRLYGRPPRGKMK